MRYEVKFSTPKDNCGYATYLTKKFHSYSPPYQIERPDGTVSQFFIFNDVAEIGRYLTFISQELKENFTLESITNSEFESKEEDKT